MHAAAILLFLLPTLWLAGLVNRRTARLADAATPLLFPLTLLLLDSSGIWTEIPRAVMLGATLTATVWLTCDYAVRRTGSAAARTIAYGIRFVPIGFFLTLGLLSLRNGGPLHGGLAWASILLGAAQGLAWAVRRQ